MRHGSSEPASPTTTDHERGITSSGVDKARSIAQRLRSMGYVPDLFLSSTSARSKQTYAAMMEVMPELAVADAHFFGSLYTESQMDGHTLPHLIDLIRRLGEAERHGCVLCLGHNKGWEEAASAMAGEKVVLKNGDAALFEMDGGSEEHTSDDAREHGDENRNTLGGWKEAMSRVGQRSGWRLCTVLRE